MTVSVANPAVKEAAVPVTFVITPEAGVPNAGVTKVGDVNRFETAIFFVAAASVSTIGRTSFVAGATASSVSSEIFWSAVILCRLY